MTEANENARVWVLWWGGSSYAMWEGTNSLESFKDEEEAGEALLSRYENGYSYRQDFQYVNKAPSSDLCPAVGADSEMWGFYSDPTNGDGDMYPDFRIMLGEDEEGNYFPYSDPC